MKKNILIIGIMSLMLLAFVSAEDIDLQNFNNCYGTSFPSEEWFLYPCDLYDFNNDLTINLIDLGYFAQYYCEETEKSYKQSFKPKTPAYSTK